MSSHDIDLVAEVHTLLNVLAPLNPDHASMLFDELVATYGRARLGAALAAAAPAELTDLLASGRPR